MNRILNAIQYIKSFLAQLVERVTSIHQIHNDDEVSRSSRLEGNAKQYPIVLILHLDFLLSQVAAHRIKFSPNCH